jgi:hypothetical protein
MFHIYFYRDFGYQSVAVESFQIETGGCKTAEESARIMPSAGRFETIVRAANTGRTHDGSPIVFCMTASEE